MTNPANPKRRLHRFIARYEHDHGYSEAFIEAPDEETALALARELPEDQREFVDAYSVDTSEVLHIEIEPEDDDD